MQWLQQTLQWLFATTQLTKNANGLKNEDKCDRLKCLSYLCPI